MELEAKARVFARAAHEAVGQTRKYTGEPYWTHPFAVAELLKASATILTPEMIAAALLHDVVEDTAVVLDTIRAEFGEGVADLVGALTHDKIEGNRAERMAHERDRLAAASDEAKTIKLADLIDNTSSIVTRDPKFAAVYMAEKRALLPALKGGDPYLWATAERIVSRYFAAAA